MTKNQIEYAKHLESRRANQAQEALTSTRDRRTYEVASRSAAEAERANRAREAQLLLSLDETVRANKAREGTEAKRVSEIERGNKATEAIRIGEAAVDALRQAEQVRSNLAQEAETALHHRAMEAKPMQPITTVTNTSQPAATPLAPISVDVVVQPQSVISPQELTPLSGNTLQTKRLEAPKDDARVQTRSPGKPTAPLGATKRVTDVSWSPVTGLTGKLETREIKRKQRNNERSY